MSSFNGTDFATFCADAGTVNNSDLDAICTLQNVRKMENGSLLYGCFLHCSTLAHPTHSIIRTRPRSRRELLRQRRLSATLSSPLIRCGS
jgi:hypothetical protein